MYTGRHENLYTFIIVFISEFVKIFALYILKKVKYEVYLFSFSTSFLQLFISKFDGRIPKIDFLLAILKLLWKIA